MCDCVQVRSTTVTIVCSETLVSQLGDSGVLCQMKVAMSRSVVLFGIEVRLSKACCLSFELC